MGPAQASSAAAEVGCVEKESTMIDEESTCCRCCWNSWFTKAGLGFDRLANGNGMRGTGVDGSPDWQMRQQMEALLGGLNLEIVVGRHKEWMWAVA